MSTDLTPLAGRWAGRGSGRYPTITDFEYLETITITPSPKGFFAYQQSTSNPTSGLPMHAEVGYFRPLDGGQLELLLVQPNGIAEIHNGLVSSADGRWACELHTVLVPRTPTAKLVESVTRRIEIVGDVLRYRLDMSAVGLPEQFHLEAELRREA